MSMTKEFITDYSHIINNAFVEIKNEQEQTDCIKAATNTYFDC